MSAAPRRGAFLAAAMLGLAVRPLGASATRIWVSDSASDFSAGEARGVSVTGRGTLALSRGLQAVPGIAEATLFCAAIAKDGTLYLGTGDAGRILRVSAANKVDVFATLPEKEVTSLALGPGGTLYAGASPGGKVYRVEGGKTSVYYETGAKYVWALVFSGQALWVGTGLPGEIDRVLSAKNGQRIHTTPDPHVRSLYRDGEGRLWAGTAGSGLVLRIDPSGSVTTVYDSPKFEISSITGSVDGRVWASAVSGETAPAGGEAITAPPALPTKPPHPPAGPEQEGKAEVTVSVSAPRLAPPGPLKKGGYSSEVVLFGKDEPPRVVWSSNEELVFQLAPSQEKESVLAATGPNGKLYRIGPDAWSLERTLDEKQVTVLAGDAIATNGPSAVYRLTEGPRKGEYVSAVKDTGRDSRFGAFRWEGEEPRGTRIDFAFRSGNSALPDTTWSAWSASTPAARVSEVAAPPARFLQWKARMGSDDGKTLPVIRRVEAAYRNRNASPEVESLLVLPPAEVLARGAAGGQNVFETSAPDEKGIFTGLEEPKTEGPPRKLLRKGYRTLTWRASDPDGDSLTYRLEARPEASSRWILLRKGLRENFYAFDTTSLPDGDYVFRLIASDADANPDEPRTATRDTSPVRIDNTPPVIRRLSGNAGVFRFEAADAASPIQEAEYSIDAKEWIRIEPEDGLSDSPTETYSISISGAARGAYLLIRVTDAARNVAAASFVVP